MKEPSGTVCIHAFELSYNTTAEEVLMRLSMRGLPLLIDGDYMLVPHPDYTYTNHTDYDTQTITVTWEKKL